MPTYTVQRGDCISSIADQNGLLWTTIWNHPANSALRQSRTDPNVLYPGDQVFVPALTPDEFPRPTDQTHKFGLTGTQAKIKVRLLDQDQPRANVPYTLEIDGVSKTGTTDGDGYVNQPLPPGAKRGKLTVGSGAAKDVHEFDLGTVDPIDQESGLRGRLYNLGFGGELLSDAIEAFQRKEGLPVTGQADAATQSYLKSRFGQ